MPVDDAKADVYFLSSEEGGGQGDNAGPYGPQHAGKRRKLNESREKEREKDLLRVGNVAAEAAQESLTLAASQNQQHQKERQETPAQEKTINA